MSKETRYYFKTITIIGGVAKIRYYHTTHAGMYLIINNTYAIIPLGTTRPRNIPKDEVIEL